MGSNKRGIKKYLWTGLAALFPTIVTIYIVIRCCLFIHRSIGKPLGGYFAQKLLGMGTGQHFWFEITASILGVILALIVVYFVGLLLASVVGRRLWRGIERQLERLPVIRLIYPNLKQISDFIFSDKSMEFSQVVALEYPRKGIYAIGFVTGDGFKEVRAASGTEIVNVFIPSSPTPVTGYVIMVPKNQLTYLSISVDEAFKYCLSGGVIVPQHQITQDSKATAHGNTSKKSESVS